MITSAISTASRARFHLQERELAYATGKYMRYPRLAHSFEVEDVCGIVRLNYARRVLFYDGDAELAPGITVHAAGGHSAGLQFVRVKTRRGYVVLASDVSHFYENMASQRPFTTAFHIGEMLEGFDRLLAIAPSESHIVPGHDPLVMKLYPAPRPELEGIAVRLDVPPSGPAPSRAGNSPGHPNRRALLLARGLEDRQQPRGFALHQLAKRLWPAPAGLDRLGAEFGKTLRTASSLSPLVRASASLSTMACGVPAGANSP